MWQPQPWEDHGGVLPDHQLARGEVPGDWRTCDGEDSVGDDGDGQYLPGSVLLYLQICNNCTTQYYQYYSTTTHYLSSIYTPDMIRVLRTLPVMELWDTVRRGETQQEDMPWRNESHAVRKFFNKVMYEGGKMAMDDCEDIIETCHGEKGSKDCCQHSEKVYTKDGLCLQISQTPTTRKDDQVGFKKDFLQVIDCCFISMMKECVDIGGKSYVRKVQSTLTHF